MRSLSVRAITDKEYTQKHFIFTAKSEFRNRLIHSVIFLARAAHLPSCKRFTNFVSVIRESDKTTFLISISIIWEAWLFNFIFPSPLAYSLYVLSRSASYFDHCIFRVCILVLVVLTNTNRASSIGSTITSIVVMMDVKRSHALPYQSISYQKQVECL